MKGWLSFVVFVFVLTEQQPTQHRRPHPLTQRNYSSVVGQGAGKVLHASTIVSGTNDRIIDLLSAMG